jgi:vacuolar protein sorting-associated protein 16
MLNDWHLLGSVQYRKWQVYEMSWSVPGSDGQPKPPPLENYLLAGAPFGGPIAMVLDSKKLTPAEKLKPQLLSIYTSSGVKISEMEWKDRPIISMGWTDQEALVIVAENGKVYIS